MSLAKGFIVFLAALAAGLAAVWYFIIRPSDDDAPTESGLSSEKSIADNAASLEDSDKLKSNKADVMLIADQLDVRTVGLGNPASQNIQGGGSQLAQSLPAQVIVPVARATVGSGTAAQTVATAPDAYIMKPGTTVATPTDPLLQATARDEYGRFVLPDNLPANIQAAAMKKILDFQLAVTGGAPTYWDGTPGYDAEGNKLPEPPNTDIWKAYTEAGKGRGHSIAQQKKMLAVMNQNRVAAGLPLETWGLS
jgi:hypothetical protein